MLEMFCQRDIWLVFILILHFALSFQGTIPYSCWGIEGNQVWDERRFNSRRWCTLRYCQYN